MFKLLNVLYIFFILNFIVSCLSLVNNFHELQIYTIDILCGKNLNDISNK